MSRILLLSLIALLVVGCGSKTESASDRAAEAVSHATEAVDHAQEAVSATPVAVASAERAVKCGCSIESVGHCGNYVEIDGKPYEIANPEAFGLGKMEWCGKSGVHATTAGSIEGGKFTATEFEVVSH